MINKVFLLGYLGQDPEAKLTEGDMSYCRFSLATNREWKNEAGEKQSETTWHNIVVWGRQAEIATQYLHKGDLAPIEGRLRNNEWEKDGQKHKSTAIVAERITSMPKREPKQQGLSPDFEREIEESARPQAVAPLKPGHMKPMEPITNLPEEKEIDVANIPF